MERPVNSHFNKDKGTSVLFFADGSTGEYSVRGAVCWPRPVEDMVDGRIVREVKGYAVLGCQDVQTGIVWIMEEREFNVIDHIMHGNIIAHEGLAPWFNNNWSRYFARKYFFQDDYELSRSHRLSIHRSVMIQPKPEMIDITTTKDIDLTHSIWRFVSLGLLRYEADGYLHKQMRTLKQDEKHMNPAIYALQLLLFGIERYPYKEKKAA